MELTDITREFVANKVNYILAFKGKDKTVTISINSKATEALTYLNTNKKRLMETNKEDFDIAMKSLLTIHNESKKSGDLDTLEGKKLIKQRNDIIVKEINEICKALKN